MAVHSYHTIEAPGKGMYKEKGSRFLAYAYPVTNEEEVRARLLALRKEYFDARHHCYAYVLGPEKHKTRVSDDGEPNHSAGDPILGQIRSRDITNVLVVVVRYFGGVKLGVGGLITAYKQAAADALKDAVIVTKEVTRDVRICYDYSSTPEVMKLVREFDLAIQSQSFKETCELTASFTVRNEQGLRARLGVLLATRHLLDVQFE